MLSSEAILAILAFGDMEDALRRQVLTTTRMTDVIALYRSIYPNFSKSEAVGIYKLNKV
jgi:hypothetical protein